jgi:SAM-dependent methyltransferase
MSLQRRLFVETEGDAWLDRNRDKLGNAADDPVIRAVGVLPVNPKCILEVGSSNGWRLDKLRRLCGCEVFGVEPSEKGVAEAAALRVPTYRGTADELPLTHRRCDLIIMGFCLYVCDPRHYFTIAAEVDRVLQDGGHLIIHDFLSPWPFCRRYEHNPEILSRHFEPHKLWTGHPAYTLWAARYDPKDGIGTMALEKDMARCDQEDK